MVNAALLAADEAEQVRLRERERERERESLRLAMASFGIGNIRATVYNRLRKLREPSGS
jgi:hypothetical protein